MKKLIDFISLIVLAIVTYLTVSWWAERSPTYAQALPLSSNVYTAKFELNDCIKIGARSPLYERSDGTISKVIYLESFENKDGYGAYLLRMVHPKIGYPTYRAPIVLGIDKNYVKTKC